GLRMKGTDGPPVDLRETDTQIKLLGFRVHGRKTGVTLSAGTDTWEDLNSKLAESWKQGNPARAAKDAVRGWIDAWGPAFENVESTADEIRDRLLRAGIQEGPTKTELGNWLRMSKDRWDAIKRDAHAPTHMSSSEG